MPPPKHKRSTDEVFSEPQRLHKVLASCGFGSRRAMEEMILAGRITVNREPAEVGQKVGPGDEVRINGDLVKVRFVEPRARLLMYHKPAGELVTRDDPEGRATVFEKLPSIGNGKWINIGRLDYNTEGLLLFTNSGELANRMMHPRFEVEREYAVRIMGRLSDEQREQLTGGIQLEDGLAKVDSVEDAGGDEDGANHWYKVVLHEGRNREVRRLFEALGLMVSRLIRTRYGVVAMPTVLKRGDLLELEAGDVTRVLESAGLGVAVNTRQQPGRGGQPPRKGARPGQDGRPGHGGRPGTRHQGGHPGQRGQGGPMAQRGQGGPAGPRGNGGQGGEGQRRDAGQGGQGQRRDGRHGGQGQRREGGPSGQGQRRDGAQGGQGNPRPPGQSDAASPRRGGHGGPGHPRPPGEGGAQGQRRPGGGKRGFGKGPRGDGPPAGGRTDYDERQPVSNANASPFGHTTLTIPGGMPLGRPEGGQAPRGPGGRNDRKGGRPGGRGPGGPGKGGPGGGRGRKGPRAGQSGFGHKQEVQDRRVGRDRSAPRPAHVPVVAHKRHRTIQLAIPGTAPEGAAPRDDSKRRDDEG